MPARTTYQRIYDAIRRVPRGKVATYGQIAGLVGVGPRQVGYALHALRGERAVPWHRVLNAAGRISLTGPGAITQRMRLEREGVRFRASGRVDLAAFGWRPAKRRRSAAVPE